MRTLALVLLALAACGGSPAPPPEVLSSHASEPLARDTAAPKITWADNTFVTATLPAVARAAEITVVALRDHDGGRGYPNLEIEVRDRNDKTIQSITILIPNEYETLAPDGKPGDVLAKRIEAANAELAKLHGVHDLVPMKPLDLQKPADGSDPHLAIGDNLDVDWNKDHLHVFPHNVDRPVTTVDGHGWLAPSHTSCAGCGVCENPAFLGAVYHAPAINIVVVEIRYHGTDTCEEPGDQPHVVAWY
jgi:hypothetical protein